MNIFVAGTGKSRPGRSLVDRVMAKAKGPLSLDAMASMIVISTRSWRASLSQSLPVGEELRRSDWYEITQDAVNQFADATGDHQWIRVDPQQAAEGPFGGPIAPKQSLTITGIPHGSSGIQPARPSGTKPAI
nr:MaoC/PaaZ C-terminal domain-containing protein [Frankia sp. Cr2]